MFTPQPLNRAEPALPAAAMKTYQVAAPLATHWRPASCAEVDCEMYLVGFKVLVDESTWEGQRQALLIRDMARPSSEVRRKFTEFRISADITEFRFPPGQSCFRNPDIAKVRNFHRAPVLRPPLLVVRDGDWRGNPRGTEPRRHTRIEFWAEDFAEHQQKLADHQRKG